MKWQWGGRRKSLQTDMAERRKECRLLVCISMRLFTCPSLFVLSEQSETGWQVSSKPRCRLPSETTWALKTKPDNSTYTKKKAVRLIFKSAFHYLSECHSKARLTDFGWIWMRESFVEWWLRVWIFILYWQDLAFLFNSCCPDTPQGCQSVTLRSSSFTAYKQAYHWAWRKTLKWKDICHYPLHTVSLC